MKSDNARRQVALSHKVISRAADSTRDAFNGLVMMIKARYDCLINHPRLFGGDVSALRKD